jgi:hypothetical protein
MTIQADDSRVDSQSVNFVPLSQDRTNFRDNRQIVFGMAPMMNTTIHEKSRILMRMDKPVNYRERAKSPEKGTILPTELWLTLTRAW